MKVSRQAKILELIEENVVETQEELAELLMKAGYQVTQATVSRDIRELNLTKVSMSNGKQKYIELKDNDGVLLERYIRILVEGFVSMTKAENIIVIRTVSGMAMAVAAALDAMKIDEIAGCIAGDDTIFCAVKHSSESDAVMKRIYDLAEKKNR